MMNKLFRALTPCLLLIALALGSSLSFAADTSLPAINATTSTGQTINLSSYNPKGITVVEWTNHQCPYVRKFYDHGTMQALQDEALNQGIRWIRVVSSAPGKQGYVSSTEANKIASDDHVPSKVLTILDPQGTVAQAFHAKTTPQVFIIKNNQVVYQGAVDDNPSVNTIASSTNYVQETLSNIAAGKPIALAQTTPYGCSIKY
jgi:hypothetical protein